MRNRTSPSLSAAFASSGTSSTSPATLGTIATEFRTTSASPLRGAPSHRDKQPEIQKQQDDERRRLPPAHHFCRPALCLQFLFAPAMILSIASLTVKLAALARGGNSLKLSRCLA